MTDTVTQDDARCVYDIIKKICLEAGPGVPTSPQERARALLIKDEMVATLGEDNVEVEEFTCAPHGFLGWLKAAVVAELVVLGFHFAATELSGTGALITSLVAFLIGMFILMVATVQFVYIRELFDALLPKRKSLNVVGRIRPAGNQAVDRILLFAGHHDSAHQFTWESASNESSSRGGHACSRLEPHPFQVISSYPSSA